MDFFCFSSFIFKKSTFHWKRQTYWKNVIVEEELDGTNIDDIGNFDDSPRLVFMDEKCGNFKVANDGGKLTRKIYWKKKSDVSNSL